MKENKLIEVLAPAGSVEGMKAAFSAGADACYIGGKLFGARAYADNPSEKALVEAIYYSHLHNKKLYLTVNTLVKEDEFSLLYDYILPYYVAGIDGIIVQDLGVLKFLYENFNGVELHASTQLTICDTTVVKFLKNYGVTRLVLSRELSLSEIENFKNFDIEIECFVHGALCVCYSGQCLMSALNGKRSGNRGSCVGNCRLSYNLYGDDKKKIKMEPYLLSTKDICTLDLIPEMVESGITSFKIEGRMKRAEYAALTAYLYRKWTDIYLKNGKEYYNSKNIKKDREADILKLSDIYNRGSFSNGYLLNYNGPFMMSSVRPNHNGVLVGNVHSVRKNKIEISVIKELNSQDVLEIRDEHRPKDPIYEFTLKNGKNIGEIFEANFTKGLVISKGLSVYRTKNEKLLTEISDNFLKKSDKIKITADFFAGIDKEMLLTLIKDDVSVTVKGSVCQRALNKPLQDDRIKTSLLKLGDTDFFMKEYDITLSLDGDVFFPMSALNELRRSAVKKLSTEIINKAKRRLPKSEKFYSLKNTTKVETFTTEVPRLSIIVSNIQQLEYVLTEIKYTYEPEIIINLELFGRGNLIIALEKLAKVEKKIPLYLRLPEVFRRSTSKIYATFFKTDEGLKICNKITGFLIRNLEELAFVKDMNKITSKNFQLIADTNLYTTNSKAVEVLYDLGVYRYTASLEQDLLEVGSVKAGLTVPSKLSIVIYGREELMVMTQCQWKNKGFCTKELKNKSPLSDILFMENKRQLNGKITKFPIIKNCETCTNYIYQDVPTDFFDKKKEVSELAPDYIRIDFTFEGEKEIREVINLANFSKRSS